MKSTMRAAPREGFEPVIDELWSFAGEEGIVPADALRAPEPVSRDQVGRLVPTSLRA